MRNGVITPKAPTASGGRRVGGRDEGCARRSPHLIFVSGKGGIVGYWKEEQARTSRT